MTVAALACVAAGLVGLAPVAGAAAQSWAVVPITQPSGFASLNAVACPGTTDCVGVGTYSTSQGLVTLAEMSQGSSWTAVATPNPPRSLQSILNGVSCTSPSFCMAVGYGITTKGENEFPFAEIWNGSVWTVRPVPEPAGVVLSTLSSVSCTARTACEAAGYGSVTTTTDATVPVVEGWDGSRWSAQVSPSVPRGRDELDAVSCATGGCLAVGVGAGVALGELWNGSRWSLAQPVTPVSAVLLGVSCPQAGACTAVGTDYQASTGKYYDYATAWNGSTWTPESIQTPADATYGQLNAVTCSAASRCTAVGGYSLGSTPQQANLAFSSHGANWTLQPTPDVVGTSLEGNNLTGVACRGSGGCTAVGWVGRQDGSTEALVLNKPA